MKNMNLEEKKVLIVDDEAGIRRNLHVGLTQHGFSIDDALKTGFPLCLRSNQVTTKARPITL